SAPDAATNERDSAAPAFAASTGFERSSGCDTTRAPATGWFSASTTRPVSVGPGGTGGGGGTTVSGVGAESPCPAPAPGASFSRGGGGGAVGRAGAVASAVGAPRSASHTRSARTAAIPTARETLRPIGPSSSRGSTSQVPPATSPRDLQSRARSLAQRTRTLY